ncbi:O-antigen ligase family protein [Brevibacillus dissolubilis]|uniref:O-antigen ligase family protein n=1 Tax=Brevibacillus dissolubilis TaxID=1844116 RepID=UPI001115DF44|nr:O-antigen ligase family protein [Brevibacillus dissolubilis]
MKGYSRWIVLCLITLIVIGSSFEQALFFDKRMYLYEVMISGLLLVVGILAWRFKEIGRLIPYTVAALIPLSFLLSLFQAETLEGGLNYVFRWGTYVCLFLILMWIRSGEDQKAQKADAGRVLGNVFHAFGLILGFFALFGLWGWVEYKDIVLNGRLTGVFQYANTFAAVTCAFWIFGLVMLSKDDGKNRLWMNVFYALPLVAYSAGLFHSYSRGTMLLFPVAWLIGLALLKGKKQVRYTWYTVLSVGIGFLVYQQNESMTAQGATHPSPVYSVIGIIGLVLLVTLTPYLVKLVSTKVSGLNRLSGKSYTRWILPGLLVVMAVALGLDLKYQGLVYQNLPEAMQSRLADIDADTNSVIGRTNMYDDALKMVGDSPLLGYGGQGWEIVYTRYQQLPYLSNETHSVYLDLLISGGIVGLAVFAGVILFYLARILMGIRNETDENQKLLAIASVTALAMLLMHAAIDFDYSFGTVGLITFWLIAMALPVASVKAGANEEAKGGQKVPLVRQVPVGKQVAFYATLALVIVLGVYETRFYLAEEAVSSLQGKVALTEAADKLEQAVAYNPYSTANQVKYAEVLAMIYQRKKDENVKPVAIKQLQDSVALEPTNSVLHYLVASSYIKLQEWPKAIELYQKAIQLEPFNNTYYGALMQVFSEVGIEYKKAGDLNQAKAYADQTMALYKQFQEKMGPFAGQEIPDRRQLDLPQTGYMALGKSFMLEGQYAEAQKVLSLVNDPQFALDAKALSAVLLEKTGRMQEAVELINANRAEAVFQEKLAGYQTIFRN